MLELLTFATVIGLSALSIALNGYALAILWGWFIVPTFGLPELSLALAIGLALVATFLTHQYQPDVQEKGTPQDRLCRVVGYVLLKPALFLGVGWIVKQWM